MITFFHTEFHHSPAGALLFGPSEPADDPPPAVRGALAARRRRTHQGGRADPRSAPELHFSAAKSTGRRVAAGRAGRLASLA